jgi:hypothetical protein
MEKFLVHTDVTAKEVGPTGILHAMGIQMLSEQHVSNVKFKHAYVCDLAICHCVNDRKIICEFDGDDMDCVREALQKIGLPVFAILAKPN